jgi:uncharacterized membrane protein YeiH
MELLVFVLEIVGTVAFAISGALTGLRKNMDIFGVCTLGLTAAVGGGVIRDIILGITPPATFTDPIYALVAVVTSIIIFFPFVRRLLFKSRKAFDILLLITDSLGLGIFTVYGINAAVNAGFGDNMFLVIFVAALTGVGGGVLRDIFAGDRPYIFVKHIYACASLAGAVLCYFMWGYFGRTWSMLAGFLLVFIIRMLAARFKWSLPKASEV